MHVDSRIWFGSAAQMSGGEQTVTPTYETQRLREGKRSILEKHVLNEGVCGDEARDFSGQ